MQQFRFGFAKFHDVRDSEKCIRGFYRRGYEVGFARVPSPRPRRGQAQQRRREQRADYLNDQESFNSRLRAEADDTSTNLYLSNLPKTYGEAVRILVDIASFRTAIYVV